MDCGEEDEENLSAIGFMFDASHEKFSTEFQISENLKIVVRNIGDCPGHKQSGQYLWPAANGLALYLDESKTVVLNSNVVELGAGCGLAGLVAAKLGADKVLFTDYDYGSLSLIEESISLNNVQPLCSTSFLEWGKTDSLSTLAVTLVIGSDLIYCKDVVTPLFTTVSLFKEAQFVLATSFALGDVSITLYYL